MQIFEAENKSDSTGYIVKREFLMKVHETFKAKRWNYTEPMFAMEGWTEEEIVKFWDVRNRCANSPAPSRTEAGLPPC